VLVSPRLTGENTPFKIYTYLASGKPLVATRIPTHTQLLDDGNAFLAEPSPQGLAAGIRSALEEPEQARARAERGYALVERDYSKDRYRAKVARAYAEIERLVARGS
jgi:glycosyltransferase involved in cell wall biosynthesis